MMSYDLPYFGQINLTELKDYYNVKLADSKLSIDLNFKNKAISEQEIEVVKAFLNNIEKFDIQNKICIDEDFKESGEETIDYINFYLEELDEEELSKIIDDEESPKDIQLLNKLKLIRVGLYPDGEQDDGCYGVFDYSIYIDGEAFNYLLVVKTNEKGELDHITWES
jgi:serine protease inhibitor